MNPLRTEWQKRNIGLEAYHPKVQKLADAAQEMAERWFSRDRKQSNLVIVGDPGCGKTHVARKLVQWARGHSGAVLTTHRLSEVPSVMFKAWPEIVSSFKEGFYGVVEDMIEADLLAIDDLGAEHDPSRNAADKLCQILSRREKKWTILTTNLQPSSWSERLDQRIGDRLFRNSMVVDMTGCPSYAVWSMMAGQGGKI